MDENPSSDAQRCIIVEFLVLNTFDAPQGKLRERFFRMLLRL